MPKPEPKPALKKAQRKEHPWQPETSGAPATDTIPPPLHDDGNETTVQMNLRVPKSLRTAIKKAALEDDTTVLDWVLDAIRSKLAGR